jgi:hypothetical protein
VGQANPDPITVQTTPPFTRVYYVVCVMDGAAGTSIDTPYLTMDQILAIKAATSPSHNNKFMTEHDYQQLPKGSPGYSAYEVWINMGNTGTVQDFIDDITGPQGPASLEYEGTWDASVTYADKDGVFYDGSFYTSLIDNNLGNTPPGVAVVNDGIWGLVAQQGDQGIPGAEFKGLWAAGVQYEPRDVVYYSGTSWVATVSNMNAQPPTDPQITDVNWQAMSAKGDLGPVGPVGIQFKGVWDNATVYQPNDVVSDGKNTWIALVSNSAAQPPADWRTITDGIWNILGGGGTDGAPLAIQTGTYREPGSTKPFPDLPAFSTTEEGWAYIVDDDAVDGQYDLYMHAVGGGTWLIVEDWGGIPGPIGPAPKILSGTWWVWDDTLATPAYIDTTIVASGVSPKIDQDNWWVWDTTLTPPDFKDTGIKATGNPGPAARLQPSVADPTIMTWWVYDDVSAHAYIDTGIEAKGQRGMTYRGTYDATLDYKVDDVVFLNGNNWIALSDNGPASTVESPPMNAADPSTVWGIFSASSTINSLVEGNGIKITDQNTPVPAKIIAIDDKEVATLDPTGTLDLHQVPKAFMQTQLKISSVTTPGSVFQVDAPIADVQAVFVVGSVLVIDEIIYTVTALNDIGGTATEVTVTLYV